MDSRSTPIRRDSHGPANSDSPSLSNGTVDSCRLGRTALAALLAVGFCLAAGSCGEVAASKKEKEADRQADGGGMAGGDAARSNRPEPSQADCEETARLFAEALVNGEYGAAYNLASSRLQKRMPREDFAQACTDAVVKFGQAEKLGPVVAELTDGLEGSGPSDQYGFPADIPDADRLAWIHASLALELDGDEVLRQYDLWMLLENDGGKARVGHFSFTLGN